MVALFPRRTEKERRTQGRYGAWKEKRPKKLIRTCGFLLAQTYTIRNVNEDPRKCRFTNGAMAYESFQMKKKENE